MSINQFLAELAQRGIKLWLEGDTGRTHLNLMLTEYGILEKNC